MSQIFGSAMALLPRDPHAQFNEDRDPYLAMPTAPSPGSGCCRQSSNAVEEMTHPQSIERRSAPKSPLPVNSPLKWPGFSPTRAAPTSGFSMPRAFLRSPTTWSWPPAPLRQMKSVADDLQELGESQRNPALSRVGDESGQWIVVDFVDVVAHVFSTDARNFYDLDNLWGDAKIIEWEERVSAAKK